MALDTAVPAEPTHPEATADQKLERVLAMQGAFLEYPLVRTIEKELEQLFTYGATGRQFGTSASVYMLLGESGSGKTALLNRFCARHPMVQTPTQDEHPVLYVIVPSKVSRKALAEEILRRLGAHIPARATEAQLTARAIHHLVEQKVKVLVLDEAQHLVIPEKARLNYDAADYIKGILNDAACSIVLAGVPEAWEAYLYNGQLRRRSFGNRRLGGFRRSEPRRWSSYKKMLEAFEAQLPFSEPSNLSEEPTALAIHYMTEGQVGRLTDFLVKCTIIAVEEDAPSLTPAVLGEAAERLADLGDDGWRNPFDMTMDQLEDVIEGREERSRPRAGVDVKTKLRRGKRGPTVRDVVGGR